MCNDGTFLLSQWVFCEYINYSLCKNSNLLVNEAYFGCENNLQERNTANYDFIISWKYLHLFTECNDGKIILSQDYFVGTKIIIFVCKKFKFACKWSIVLARKEVARKKYCKLWFHILLTLSSLN